jgi:hypothetical protein
MRLNFVFSALLCAEALCFASVPALAAPSGYPMLDDARAFRGRILYVAHRADSLPAPRIEGSLTITNVSWRDDERTSATFATAGNRGAALQGGGYSTVVDDPLASGAIVNAWTVALGTLTASPGSWASERAAIWKTAGLQIYLSATRDRVAGIADSAGGVSFAFDGWQDVGGLRLPGRVMRLRDGAPEASYSIEDYRVMRSPAFAALAVVPQPKPPEFSGSAGVVAVQPPIELPRVSFPMRLIASLFGLLLLAVFLVAWTRRETLLEELRQRIQADPRGWQSRGVSVFVSADGRMWFDGAEYVIGPQFYGRQAVVQASPLFLRIGARDVPRAIVVARKFRIPALRAAKNARMRTAGLSLIENIVAIGLFSAVVVGAVYPTLVVMASGDRIAREHDDAVQIAANALTDEEVASAYGTVSDGAVTSHEGAMTVVVTIGPSQSGVASAHDVDVAVTGPSGSVLAHVVSTLGPAVPAPPPPDHTPNPSPEPSG